MLPKLSTFIKLMKKKIEDHHLKKISITTKPVVWNMNVSCDVSPEAALLHLKCGKACSKLCNLMI